MTIYPDDGGDGASPFEDLFDPDRLSDLHKIQQGRYDWGRQPLWARHLNGSCPALGSSGGGAVGGMGAARYIRAVQPAGEMR